MIELGWGAIGAGLAATAATFAMMGVELAAVLRLLRARGRASARPRRARACRAARVSLAMQLFAESVRSCWRPMLIGYLGAGLWRRTTSRW
ncbi:MAG: hypothetical protein R3B99_01515 [Polyangiales bacterium]